MLPFGGYVKIAGMQKEGNLEPSEIPDGFYGKKPWARIQVAFAGPLVNIVFALVVFCVLWFSGGRDKQFTEFTHRIGWVDPKSMLYEYGVRPGDVIEKYDGRAFGGFKDLLISSIMKGDTAQIEGTKINYLTGEKYPYNYTLETYQNPEFYGKEKLKTIGVLSPARYMIYDGSNLMNGPMQTSWIQPKDRVLWVDGEVVFSHQQLSALTNESAAFLTVKRQGEVFQTKVPRVQLADLKMTMPEKGEIDDWQHEAGLKNKFQDLYFIPYNLSPSLMVESRLGFIDQQDQAKAFKPCKRCKYFRPLEEGDEILAVDGKRVQTPYELLTVLQQRHVLMIVERNPELSQKILWTKADDQFADFSIQNLSQIVSSIGTDHLVSNAGDLHLLNPITPKPLNQFLFTDSQKTLLEEQMAKSKKEIESIQDPSQRSVAYRQLDQSQKKLVLGLPLAGREVLYNPSPKQQFVEVLKDTYRTLLSLFSGTANPKYIAGPVGIVQIVHQSWMVGLKEALFWMALISLNLGIINLLPLPVLDGGHIMFSIVEIFTKKPIKAKTMERMIIPFIVLLIVSLSL